MSFTIGRSQSRNSAAGSDERAERERAATQVLPFPEGAHREEAEERDPEEDRVGRVDDGQREACRGGREHEAARRRANAFERERERGRHEQLTRRRRRQRQEDVGAPVTRREADHRDLRRRRSRPPPTSRRKSAQPASNATTTASAARSDGRCTTTRSGSSPATFAISATNPCQSGKAYPGCRLPSENSETRFERQRAEIEELADPREMEEPVALHGRRGHPDHEPDHRAPEERPRAAGHALGARPRCGRARSTASGRADREQERESQVQRRAERERDRERCEHDDQGPRDRRRQRSEPRARARRASPERARPRSRTRV